MDKQNAKPLTEAMSFSEMSERLSKIVMNRIRKELSYQEKIQLKMNKK